MSVEVQRRDEVDIIFRRNNGKMDQTAHPRGQLIQNILLTTPLLLLLLLLFTKKDIYNKMLKFVPFDHKLSNITSTKSTTHHVSYQIYIYIS